MNIILFKYRDSDRKFVSIVIELSYFKSFREAILDSGLRNVIPNARSLDKAVNLYESYPHKLGNYKIASDHYGVLRIKLELL
jgi:ASC-1-like (ASCH) protein